LSKIFKNFRYFLDGYPTWSYNLIMVRKIIFAEPFDCLIENFLRKRKVLEKDFQKLYQELLSNHE